ncbi:MAG TPA: MFS transporter [Candidatus Acidoferrales bacterium]|jgi:MFS family permease|nr:MFS transporter [Candidatus Acidoferrales bacterium]
MNGAAPAPSVFASRTFRLYFAGQSLSFIGDGLRLLSVPLLAFHLTHSALSTGTALICEVAPYSLFALIGGSLADRVDRRRLMIGCDFVRFIVMSFFAIAYVLHELTLLMIYIGLIVISICAAGFVGGQMSSIPYLLGRDQATKGNAVLIAAESTSNLITPAIGGALFATLGPLPALVVNALTYLGSQISLVLIPSMGPDQVTGLPTLRHLLDDVALGFRQLWGDLGMRAQALTAFSFNVFGFGGYAILIPFLKKGFGASDQQVGIFFGVSALGAIAGASLAARYPDRWPFGRALVIAYLCDALFFLPVVLVSNIWVAAFFWATSNAIGNFELAQILGFRMRVTPGDMVGRVMGSVRLLVLAGIAPAVILFGWVADHRSPHAAMAISAAGYIVIALVAIFTPAIRNETR